MENAISAGTAGLVELITGHIVGSSESLLYLDSLCVVRVHHRGDRLFASVKCILIVVLFLHVSYFLV